MLILLNHYICGNLLQQQQKKNTGGDAGIDTSAARRSQLWVRAFQTDGTKKEIKEERLKGKRGSSSK